MAEDKKQPAGSQVENLRDNLLPEPTGEDVDPKKPRIPFVTSYVLDRDQEDALVNHAIERIKQLEDQLGRVADEGLGGARSGRQKRFSISHPESFFGKRDRLTYHFYNHVEYRKKKDTIYETSNLTASLSQRISMQMIARAIAFFFGQPDDIDWFSTEAVGAEDQAESDKIKKHSRWKVDQCGVKYRFIEALEYAFVRGEAVIKPTHQQRSQIYKRTATILMGGQGEDGQPGNADEPMLDAHGDYIVQGDKFVEEMAPAPEPKPGLVQTVKNFLGVGESQPAVSGQTSEVSAEGQPAAPMAPPEPMLQPTGRMVLKRDGVTVLPEVPIWKEQVITRQLITFEGPDVPVVYFKDFLCPENATDIQTADLIAHLYDMNVMQIAQMFRGQYGEGDSGVADMKAAVDRLRAMTGESNQPKAAAGQARTDMKESDTTGAQGVPICEIAECYLTYDADGDGIQEEIMLVLDRRNSAPIFYEYVANVTVRGERPFYVWRPMPVDQRWYGMGSMELFDPEQEFVDLQVNRYNFANSKAGRIDFWNPSATVEGSRDPNLKMNHGRTYSLRDGKKKEDAYDFAQVPFDGDNLAYLINLFTQFMQLKSGVLSGADRATTGMPSSDTLGEEELITQSGDELFGRMLAHLFPGVKKALRAVIDVIYANLNEVEIFNYFNGQANEILSLEPDDVRDLALNVTLELSRTQQRKAVDVGDKTQALIAWFYALSPPLQQRVADYARQQLKALGVSQADQIILPLSPLELPPPAPNGSEAQNGAEAVSTPAESVV